MASPSLPLLRILMALTQWHGLSGAWMSLRLVLPSSTRIVGAAKPSGKEDRAGPQEVSRKGVSMKRSNFPMLGHFVHKFQKDIFRNRPDHGYPFCGNPFGPCREKHISINKFGGLSRDWVGDKNLLMCVFWSFLVGEKHMNKSIPWKSWYNPNENYVYVCVFFSFGGLFAPKIWESKYLFSVRRTIFEDIPSKHLSSVRRNAFQDVLGGHFQCHFGYFRYSPCSGAGGKRGGAQNRCWRSRSDRKQRGEGRLSKEKVRLQRGRGRGGVWPSMDQDSSTEKCLGNCF